VFLSSCHPWTLILSDIAAKNDVVIDIHMEATDETISAIGRLLAHNRNAKIIWAHAGWSVLGMATANAWERLMARHPNLYGSIKHRKLGRPKQACVGGGRDPQRKGPDPAPVVAAVREISRPVHDRKRY